MDYDRKNVLRDLMAVDYSQVSHALETVLKDFRRTDTEVLTGLIEEYHSRGLQSSLTHLIAHIPPEFWPERCLVRA